MTPWVVGPVNGGSPASISYSTAERVESLRIDLRSAVACSGLMYCGVPSENPVSREACAARLATASAMPKSATSAVPVGEQDILRLDVAMHDALAVGVVERAATAVAMRSASSIGSWPRASRRARRDSPSTKRHHVEEEPVGARRSRRAGGLRVLQRGVTDLPEKALAAEHAAELGTEDLEGDVGGAEVARQVDGGHPPAPISRSSGSGRPGRLGECARFISIEQAAELWSM